KRIIIISLLLSIICMILSSRLYYLQDNKKDEYTLNAMKQRGKEFSIYPNRGMIFDRHLKPITNNELTHTIIIEKKLLIEDQELYDKVIKSTSLDHEELNEEVHRSKDLLQIPLKNINLFDYDDNRFFIVDTVKRYSKGNPLAHVIGYTSKSDNVGESGIEEVHNEFLSTEKKTSFMVEYDRDRSMILGGGYYVNQSENINNPSGVKLTVDLDIQNIVEKTLDAERLNGAVVVSEVKSGDILALASRPKFRQDNVDISFTSKGTTVFNRAIQVGYPPGSIFKIVVLLAALEENPEIKNDEFYCPGYEEVNGERFKCSSVHGKISIEEAFAK